jgi:plasmid maintenance system antidote protein VapI
MNGPAFLELVPEGVEDADDGKRLRWTSAGRKLLVAWLASNGVSTDALARALGHSPAAIRKLTSGATAEPSLTLALALHKRTGVTPDAWVTDRSSSTVTLVTARRGMV